MRNGEEFSPCTEGKFASSITGFLGRDVWFCPSKAKGLLCPLPSQEPGENTWCPIPGRCWRNWWGIGIGEECLPSSCEGRVKNWTGIFRKGGKWRRLPWINMVTLYLFESLREVSDEASERLNSDRENPVVYSALDAERVTGHAGRPWELLGTHPSCCRRVK